MVDRTLFAFDTIPVLTFTLGGQHYALLVDDVIEVAAMVEMVVIHDAPPGLLGLVNRHGEPLPVFDLSVLMGYDPIPIDISTLFIVVQYSVQDQQQLAGLVVEHVHQVEYVARSSLRKSTTSSSRIHGIINSEERMMQVISPASVLPSDGVS